MEQSNTAVVSIARNEEQSIGSMLESLQNQSVLPYRIIIVDDGSTDRTSEIASKYERVKIVKRATRNESYVARKELATTFNKGLEKLFNDSLCRFIAIVSPDLVLPSNYLETITERMKKNQNIAISSGMIKGEYSVVPRGAGRVVRYDFWKSIGLQYPLNYGFEGYLILKAQSMGYETTVFSDLLIHTTRKTGTKYKPELYYNYGKGLKALGYTFPYAIMRILLFAKKKPKGAYYMLKGYLSRDLDLYEKELRDYVRRTQYYNITHFNKEYFKRALNLIKQS